MKKIFSLVFVFFLLISCSKKIKTDELYDYGLELTKLMETLVKDSAYREVLGTETYDDFIDENVVANDYDSPIKVYEVTKPIAEKFFEQLPAYDKEKYDRLSEEAKEQIYGKVNYNTVCTSLNSVRSEHIIVSTMLTISKTFSGSISNEIGFLYVFETGVPIFVTFKGESEILANATFVFSDDLDTLSKTREIFGVFGCEVKDITRNNW